MKLSEIQRASRNTPVASQNTRTKFPARSNLARWIVDQAQITPDDYVVEIGPGLGALTRFILEKARMSLRLKKTRASQFLRAHLDHERLEILNIDALKFDQRELAANKLHPG